MKKRCSKCGIEKDLALGDFAKRKSSKDGYDSHCKDCRKEYDAKRYPSIREDMLVHKKEYYSDNCEYLKNYYLDYYAKNKEKCNNAEKEWRKNNPDKRAIITERRRTRERNLSSTLALDEWTEIKSHFNNACAYCGIDEESHLKENGELLHQEHVIPLIKGGGYDKGNIIPSCRSCNSSKSNKDFCEWYLNSKVYDKNREAKIMEHMNLHEKESLWNP